MKSAIAEFYMSVLHYLKSNKASDTTDLVANEVLNSPSVIFNTEINHYES